MGLKRRLDGVRRRLGNPPAERDPKPARKPGSAAARKRSKPGRGGEPKPGRGEPAKPGREARRDASGGASKRGAQRNPNRVSDSITKLVAALIGSLRAVGVRAFRLWFAVAEWTGARMLAAWRRLLRPLLIAIWGLLAACYRLALRHVTPARAVAAVAVVALVALVASQWLDYRVLRVGIEGYSGNVELVTSAPELERVRAGEAHAWVMLPLALAGAVALAVALAGRPRAARLMVAIGLAVIAVALFVDAPKGLDEGQAAIVYEGARASLLDGFWIQLATGVVVIACGALLPRYLRPERAVKDGAADRTRGGARPGAISRAAARLRRRSSRRGRSSEKRRVEGVST